MTLDAVVLEGATDVVFRHAPALVGPRHRPDPTFCITPPTNAHLLAFA
jgi:hypothetical protein